LADRNGFYAVEGGGKIKKMEVIKILQNQASRAKFPTAYAAKNDEEHFAEAFAMYVIGDLDPQHREAFESIIVKGEDLQPEPVKTERVVAPPPEPEPPKPEPEPEPEPESDLPTELPSGIKLYNLVKRLEAETRRRRTKKVLTFVEGVRKTLEDGGRLGPKAEQRLTRILQSYGMLADGSSRRVAARFLGGM
jgi:hypothetical protein